MELTALYRCVAALDIHQAKLTVCLLYENELGELLTEVKEFGGFKKDRNAMAQWIASFKPDLIVMGEYRYLLEKPLCGFGKVRLKNLGRECQTYQASSRAQNGYCGCALAGYFGP